MKGDKQETPAADAVDKVVESTVGNEGKEPSDIAGEGAISKEKSTVTKETVTPPAFNPETSHKELIDRYNRQEKNYKELQKHATQQSMKASDLEKKLDQVLSQLSKATEVEIDPQEFIREINEKGHRPIVDLISKEVDKVRKALVEEHGKVTTAQEGKLLSMEADLWIERMGRDAKNFPGFDELKEQFGEILDDPNCPIREDLPIADQLKSLYNIAKARSADQAVILAKEAGKKDAETQLAKEAGAHTAGGGKTAGTTEPDWDSMPLDKHRKALIDMYGIRE